jgi:hypothetical protein
MFVSSSEIGVARTSADPDSPGQWCGGDEVDLYVSPVVIDLGDVREATKGSSGSGKADANSQYYWG